MLKHSRSKLAARLVLLAIADHAHRDGAGADPGVRTISEEANIDERHARRCVAELEQSGELLVDRNRGRYASNLYAINLPGLAAFEERWVNARGDKLTPLGPVENHLQTGSRPDKNDRSGVTKTRENVTQTKNNQILNPGDHDAKASKPQRQNMPTEWSPDELCSHGMPLKAACDECEEDRVVAGG